MDNVLRETMLARDNSLQNLGDIIAEGLQEELGEWAQLTFPDQTEQTIALHMVSEVVELCFAVGVDLDKILWCANTSYAKSRDKYELTGEPPSPAEECADVAVLANTFADENGFSLVDQVRAKFEKLKLRTWQPRNPVTGIREHVPTEEQP